MKHQRLATALAICLFSSLALGDNPSDAPLVSGEVSSAVDQQATEKQVHQDSKQHSREPKAQKEYGSKEKIHPAQNCLDTPPSATTDQGKQ